MTNSETNYYSQGLDFLLKNSYKQGVSDVLDKIRVKIEGYKSTIDNAISEDTLKIEGMKEAYADCLNVIDECKAEIEPQEGSEKE